MYDKGSAWACVPFGKHCSAYLQLRMVLVEAPRVLQQLVRTPVTVDGIHRGRPVHGISTITRTPRRDSQISNIDPAQCLLPSTSSRLTPTDQHH